MSQPLPKPKPAPEERRALRLAALGQHKARFRELIGKVGSGEHTSTGLDRSEAREAMDLMLQGEATAAQIGAFLIAHRIRRPSPIELAGMLDSYRNHGPKLQTTGRPALCFGVPYDGRSRTAPLLPLVALVLAAAGLPVVMHGGNPMPIKFGVTLAELFRALGIEWTGLSIPDLQAKLDAVGVALTHQPDHFPAAENLVKIRDEIGKRPPVASLELLWTPHQGPHLLVSGFVHPPTELRAWEALKAAGENAIITVKGLEGSTDLPTTRACITGRVLDGKAERLLLHPREHGIQAAEVAWSNIQTWKNQALDALKGEGPLADALRWNVGSLLWLSGQSNCLSSAIEQATALLHSRAGLAVASQLQSQQ